MKREEAKYILRSYRASGQDADDPQFREALETVSKDATLQAWFSAEQELDELIADKVQSFPIAPNLKEQVLAARAIKETNPWSRHPGVILKIAAVFCVIAGVCFFGALTHRSLAVNEFKSFVADAAATLDHLDLQTNNVAAARNWLAVHHAPDEFILPARLNGKPSLGCRVFKWHDKPVSLVCFEIENRKVAHMFVMDRSGFDNRLPNGQVSFETIRGITTASWNDERRIYVVATRDGESELKRLLL